MYILRWLKKYELLCTFKENNEGCTTPDIMADILIVDDNEVTVKSVEHLLSKEGYVVVSATNGREAMRLLNDFNFDLVVTDLMMPFVSGTDLVKYIKNDLNKQDLPIIMVSSIKDEKSKMECYNLGVDIYLTKPIMPTELYVMIKKLLRH